MAAYVKPSYGDWGGPFIITLKYLRLSSCGYAVIPNGLRTISFTTYLHNIYTNGSVTNRSVSLMILLGRVAILVPISAQVGLSKGFFNTVIGRRFSTLNYLNLAYGNRLYSHVERISRLMQCRDNALKQAPVLLWLSFSAV